MTTTVEYLVVPTFNLDGYWSSISIPASGDAVVVSSVGGITSVDTLPNQTAHDTLTYLLTRPNDYTVTRVR